MAKLIIAIGPSDVSSINYLRINNAAYVIDGKSNVELDLKKFLTNDYLLNCYANNVWKCGIEKHLNKIIKAKFYDKLLEVNARFKVGKDENSSN
ncbi:MAG: hypothetical protein R3Y45_06730 [Bacillota bacterium]